MLIDFSQTVQTRELRREKNAYLLFHICINSVRSTTYTVATLQHSLKLLCKNLVIQMKKLVVTNCFCNIYSVIILPGLWKSGNIFMRSFGISLLIKKLGHLH